MSYKRIRSLERGVAVLQCVNHMGSATAGDIARKVGLPRPTVYRILDTLIDSGLIYRSPSAHKVYRLTQAVGRLSGEKHAEPIVAAARTVLHEAAARTPWPVFLVIRSPGGVIVRETTRGSTVFWTQFGWVGAEAPILEVAPGLVLVAFASTEIRKELLSDAPEEVSRNVAAVASAGFAMERDGQGRLIGLAVPVGQGEDLAGSLTIIWEVGDESDEALIARYIPMLRDFADQIIQAKDAAEPS